MAVSEEESSSSSSAGCSSKSRSAASRGASYLAKTVLRGSVVLQVVYGRIRSSTSYDVVLGKVAHFFKLHLQISCVKC